MPEDEPDRQGDRHRRPQPLADRAAHVADRMALAAEFARDHRRGRGHQADAEDQEGEIEVRRQRPGGQHVGTEPAHHHDVGRAEQHLREVGQDQRPGQRKRGANLRAPHGARSCCHVGNVVHVGEVLARQNPECHLDQSAGAGAGRVALRKAAPSRQRWARHAMPTRIAATAPRSTRSSRQPSPSGRRARRACPSRR